jgi:hypothetical protein
MEEQDDSSILRSNQLMGAAMYIPQQHFHSTLQAKIFSRISPGI